MITKILTISQLKSLFLEILINKTDKLSDISDNSILNATAFGVGKIAQKAIKDIAIVESHIFPNSASGEYLDSAAELFGVSPRNETGSKSSTFIRVSASSGTQYLTNVHVFSSYNGTQFEVVEDLVVGDQGYAYVKVRSISVGSDKNVDPNTVIFVSPQPAGHVACSNEYKAIGGEDIESDELFRLRISKHLNILSKSTIEYLTEVFRQFNSDILKVINLGNNENGQRQLAIVLQNGVELTELELDSLLQQSINFFPITDINIYGEDIGIKLVNVIWEYIDMDFRVQVDSTYNTNDVRKQIQINLTKYLDFRFWEQGRKVEWDDLLQIIKDTEGVKYVPDINFTPQVDINVEQTKLPRFRGFIMRDMSGNIILDNNNELYPLYYTI